MSKDVHQEGFAQDPRDSGRCGGRATRLEAVQEVSEGVKE